MAPLTMRLLYAAIALLLLPAYGCGGPSSGASSSNEGPTRRVTRPGAAVLASNGFDYFAGQTIGLIANNASRVDTLHVIDRLHRSGVRIGAVFGPEHGFSGTAEAGEKVLGVRREPRTGAPIYSLYGTTRKPTAEMLAGLDVLVYDLQGVGARFYTRLSTLGLAMQAAAEAGLAFVVLDRPNPLGGAYVSGFMMEPDHQSFVGKYPLPVAHGLTVGELALMIKGEGLVEALGDLHLDVVEMEGWERRMRWPDTGLTWIASSPNIPSYKSALAYAGTCFFEATSASEGRGTDRPFTLLGAPWIDGNALAETLEARELPGVRFEPEPFTPRPNAGDSSPKLEGRQLQGVHIVITDAEAYRPVETGIHVLHAFYQQAERQDLTGAFVTRPEWLSKLAGTQRLLAMLKSGAQPEEIVAAWQDEIDVFRKRRRPYLLY